jgi:SAM-dependent methyltransferase
MRDRIAAGGTAEEDERSADWIHLLPASPTDAVVVGCGWGAVACALAAAGARVHAVDVSADRLAFVAARAEQQGLAVRSVRATTGEALPVDGSFDLIAYADPAWPGGTDVDGMAREAARLLRPGGHIAWRADNAAGPLRGRGGAPTFRALSNALRRHGFTEALAYAPLPDRGIPFFHVPLGGGIGMRYFLRHVLPLVATASPDTLRRYGVPPLLLTLAPYAASVPGLARLAETLVPGWLLIARRGTSRAR